MNAADEYLMTPVMAAEVEPSPDAVVSQKVEPSLGRVIDVPLTVMLRFGECRMRLQDVLALTTGSVMSLDRELEEPVELLLGDRVLARGEVLLVDGNYGMRVTAVVEAAALGDR